jgi:hypothetical protein
MLKNLSKGILSGDEIIKPKNNLFVRLTFG